MSVQTIFAETYPHLKDDTQVCLSVTCLSHVPATSQRSITEICSSHCCGEHMWLEKEHICSHEQHSIIGSNIKCGLLNGLLVPTKQTCKLTDWLETNRGPFSSPFLQLLDFQEGVASAHIVTGAS